MHSFFRASSASLSHGTEGSELKVTTDGVLFPWLGAIIVVSWQFEHVVKW